MAMDRMHQLQRKVDVMTQEFINDALDELFAKFNDLPKTLIMDELRGNLRYLEYELTGVIEREVND